MGKTTRKLKMRISEHKSSIRRNDRDYPVAAHFNDHKQEFVHSGSGITRSPGFLPDPEVWPRKGFVCRSVMVFPPQPIRFGNYDDIN